MAGKSEEPEISELLKKELSRRMAVHTGVQAEEVKSNGHHVSVTVNDLKAGGEREFTAQRVLVAVGRRSNADLLRVENTGVEVDKGGFIRVNEYLETSKRLSWRRTQGRYSGSTSSALTRLS